ncbi:MAG: sensor domain-containing diguanylate cyclase [Chloroflexi bacterium]|nr:sensor domain-containing diguanylate cyclase [Chloroflexota bacterium]
MLDMRTVILSYAVTNTLCVIVLAFLWSQSRTRIRGAGLWVVDFILQCLGLLCITLRGVLPSFFSIILGNAFIVGGQILFLVGLEQFTGKPLKQARMNALLFAAFILIHSHYTYIHPSLQARNINFSMALFLVFAQCAWLAFREAKEDMRLVLRIAGIIFTLYGLANVARIAANLARPPGEEFFELGNFEVLLILLSQILFIALTFSLVLAVNRRLVSNLEHDIKERKQTEDALRLAEENYRVLVEQMPAVVYLDWPDESASSFYISPQVEKLLGCPPSAYIENPTLWHQQIHPEDYDRAVATIRKTLDNGFAIEEYRAFTKDGRTLWIRDSSVLIKNASGEDKYIQGFIEDITERKLAEMQLRKQLAEINELQTALREQAIRDPLTGLYNRLYMEDAVAQECARASRTGYPLSIIILDLDHLKEINGKYGHITGGDAALRTLGEHLKSLSRAGDILCRYGGDEFLIVLHNTSGEVAVQRVEEWRRLLVLKKIKYNEIYFTVSFSAGIASIPSDGRDFESVLLAADSALFRAKDEGRNRVKMHGRV